MLSRAREVERALVSRESIRLFFARACAREEERGRRSRGVRGVHELLTSVEFCASRMIEAISGLLGLSPGLVDHASAMAPLPSATHDEVATGFWGEGGASSISTNDEAMLGIEDRPYDLVKGRLRAVTAPPASQVGLCTAQTCLKQFQPRGFTKVAQTM